ncbi:malate dehydrogenase [bioreactor metagenome]|jgi:malate dehydrogenase|uniref:Malate dehydrogenase n=1 Tax=bioreactor metagenome TaxID=1076179 RepID=A0A644VFL4_9ZZZZ|nr:malate dehydrogenase [Bacteroidales bacterium]MBP8677054.1 malate dehydrogenase [Bacteroidales bacterium]MBP9584667.1 malate dehydrogenase [Bacteroidales bacterium]MBP9977633.1 malate dehydrogenase [Bacteroidales bacterium]WRQ32291.1 malate dehydrogenase [Bacteroidales bacterium MB20-C3-3]
MSKVTVIGAGNVGATCVNAMNMLQFAGEIVLLDIKEGIAEGKAIDMMQTAKLLRFDTTIKGVTNDYAATAKSKVVVITSGIPRKPGMTREELIGTNAEIVGNVVENALKYSPNAIFVIISNPMDTMTYLTVAKAKLPKNKVIGMGGILDSNRFVYYLRTALKSPASDVAGMVIGGHGDTTMIPLIRFANLRGIPVSELLPEDVLSQVVKDTMVGGATLTKHLGTSAWYAPGAAAAALVRSIVLDEKKIYPCSVMLEGEYGQSDICLGVPVVVGRHGWEKVVELNLNAEEQEAFNKSADAVRATNNVLKDLNII